MNRLFNTEKATSAFFAGVIALLSQGLVAGVVSRATSGMSPQPRSDARPNPQLTAQARTRIPPLGMGASADELEAF